MKDEDRKEEQEIEIMIIEPGIDPEDSEGVLAPCCFGGSLVPLR